MEGRLAIPFHFAVEFLVLVVAFGAAIDGIRARRHGAGLWSLGHTAGFLLLGAAQVVHGSLLAHADADMTVIVMRTIAFVALALWARPAMNVLPSTRTTGVAMSPAFFIPGVNASLAIAPAVAALGAAARGVRAHREDQDPATFAFAAAFVAFAIGESATAAAPSDGGGLLIAAHASRALAALFLARWLWSSVVRSVRMRFVASLVAVLTITVLLLGAVMSVVIGDRIQADQLERLGALGDARATSIYERGESAYNTAGLFAGASPIVDEVSSPIPRGAGARRSRQRSFESYLQGLAVQFEPDFIMVVDAAGRVRGTAENTPNRKDGRGRIAESRALSLAGLPVVKNAPTYGVQTVPYTDDGVLRTDLVVVGAYPVPRPPSTRRGAVIVGYRLDRAFLENVKEDSGGADATLIVASDAPVVTTLEDPAAVREALLRHEDSLREAREANASDSLVLSVEGRSYGTAFVPIATQRGRHQVMGMLALSLSGDVLADAQIGMTRTLFILTLFAMMIAAMLAWMSGGRVTRPIRSLTHAARELRQGNLDARARVASGDEVGALGTAFNEMAAELQRTTGDLRSAATTEATLRARMEAILQSMGDGLIATDPAGKIVMYNRAAERMLGRRSDKAIGRALKDVMQGTTSAGASIADEALKGRSTDGQLVAGNVTLPVAISSAPLVETEAAAAGRVIVVRDMSSEYQAERMKREFLANVSHELRTPITPIKGYADILSRKKFPREKVVEFLEAILESTERLERVADILVDFAALEAGKLKPKSEAVDLRGLLDQVTQRWRARSKTHTFVRRGGANVPAVLADHRLLNRSLDELIDNAVKFSPDGGPIEISAEPYVNGSRSRKPQHVKITVRDRGIGIDEERMPDLFEEFRQLDGSETRSFGGLGLGLAYVKRIANVHGGDVQVESRPGRGSAFSIVLPLVERDGQAPRATRAAGARRRPAAKAARR